MSLFVKGAKMPKECMTCPACQGDECWFEDDRPQIPDILNRRRKWCRLVEVKSPHGRLIDADRLIIALRNSVYANAFFSTPTLTLCQIEQLIEQQPTVIEAEVSE